MYNAQFISNTGVTFNFGLEWGTAFDVDPLSGLDVDVSVSQGFQQIGNTVTGMSVQGVKRKVSGVITDRANDVQIANNMQKALSAFTRGKFVVENRYCDAIVQKTPEFVRMKNGMLTFALQIFCPLPYWMSTESTVKRLGGYTAAFRFPVNYSKPHKFGDKAESAFVNCEQPGEVDVPYKVQFTAQGEVRNFGLIDTRTMDHIKIFETIVPGHVVEVGREDGQLYVRKKLEDGTVEDIFMKLDESSVLFSLRAGDNVLKATADEGERLLTAFVEYTSAYIGVVS